MLLVADWATTAALLAVLLAEGVRRLPAGAIVLRRTWQGSWRIVYGPAARSEWRLVSTWAPIFEHLVLHTAAPVELLPAIDPGARDEAHPRLPSRLTIGALRLAGALALVGVAIGVPVATATFGTDGLVRALAAVFIFSAFVALAAAGCLASSLGGWTAALLRTKSLASPFAAPRAAECILQEVVGGWAPSAAIGALVRQQEFAGWYRTHAYDALETLRGRPDRAAESARLEGVLSLVPPACGADEPYCPRCAAVFRPGITQCSDCETVPLRVAVRPLLA